MTQDIASYETTQETLVLLKILALGQKQIEAGQVTAINNMAQLLKNKGEKA